MRNSVLNVISVLILFAGSPVLAQISPGKLAAVHSHLEGISNCTQCHTLGDKVTNDKCLACHTELKSRIDQNKGYHASSEIKGKSCVTCHNDHHGENYQIVRFDKTKFNHNLTGFGLTGAHAKKTCPDCHKPGNISNKTIKNKKFTYLGLSTECVTCHIDYHQKTLGATCTNCHTNDAFKPASKFNHATTKFPLTGMHQTVPCVQCHKVTLKNGEKFQEFAILQFSNCSNCHTDPHQNKFGPNCIQCHSNESFHTIKGISNFDHSKTSFKLENKHQAVPCKSCHKNNLTDPLKYKRCTDCHTDYHQQQFTKQGVQPDCSTCHSTKGFAGSSYTIEQHNTGPFSLKGAHLATPCLACHKKQEKWSFREIGIRCVDCHQNIHENYITKKYYPENNCETCHNPSRWAEVTFDHTQTQFNLTGVHATQTCRSCHFRKDSIGQEKQQFSGLSTNCTNCHADIHYRQFEANGVTNCLRCHTFVKWKIDKFDHSTTAFKLDGKHQNVACPKCHKTVNSQNVTFVLYKIKDTKCESCH
jgi:hypothetical protein